MKETILLGVTMAVLLSLTGCSTIKLPDVPITPASSYKFHQEQAGLTIALEPFLEPDRVKETFGLNLLSEGVLPLLLVVDNHSDELSFSLQLNTLKVRMGDNDYAMVLRINDSSEIKGATGAETAVTIALLDPIPSLIAGTILVFYYSKSWMDPQKIRYNIINKEWMQNTISPGTSHSGFLYLKFVDESTMTDITAFQIDASNLNTGELHPFSFPIKTYSFKVSH